MTGKCPHCGRIFDELTELNLIPDHGNPLELRAKASYCAGSGQYPRNPWSDHRPLWQDENNELEGMRR